MLGAALTMLLATVPSGAPPPRDPAVLRATVLAVHNRERARAGVPPLVWSETLAAHAATYAAVLARTAGYEHDPTPGRRRIEGENLWRGQRGLFSYDVVLGMMTAEARYLRPGRYPDVSATGNWSDLAHYTQMIWPTTTEVGCAMAASARDEVLVCRYAPPGNKDGVWLR